MCEVVFREIRTGLSELQRKKIKKMRHTFIILAHDLRLLIFSGIIFSVKSIFCLSVETMPEPAQCLQTYGTLH